METGLDEIHARPPLAFLVPESIAAPSSTLFEIQSRSCDQDAIKSPMYIPGSPSLNPVHLLKGHLRQNLPFPLDYPEKTRFYVARNRSYQLIQPLLVSRSGIVHDPA